MCLCGLEKSFLKKRCNFYDSPLPNKPTFIALSCSAPLDPIPTGMLTVQITLPYSKAEIGLKWQVSEISALAELLKALTT